MLETAAVNDSLRPGSVGMVNTFSRELSSPLRLDCGAVLERVTIADLARGELPLSVEELASNPDAWQPH